MALSASFSHELSAAGYLTEGQLAEGMTVGNGASRPSGSSRFDFMFDRRRFPLRVDALFCAGGTPTMVFLDATADEPADATVLDWHGLAWNFGLAPLLWISTPTRILLLNSYAPPQGSLDRVRIAEFDLRQDGELRRATSVCGRLAFDTGSFWRSEQARRITRRERVDVVLLRELAAVERHLTDQGLDQLFAQKLIGRMIFSQYLIDRGLLDGARLECMFGRPRLSELLRNPSAASGLFDWLKRTFNGDLFPPEVLGEREIVQDAHLRQLADFLDGFEASSGQRRLFPFRFDVIPVELISSIYEQFAHSAAGVDAAAQGLHYTPINLVDLALDSVFADVRPDAKVLDPACGSGVFLVEAMRRLVHLRSQSEPCTRSLVRDVLHNQIFGVDINGGALQVTAFSLYLAALELDPELPDSQLDWLRFDHLIGRTLHEGSYFEMRPDPGSFDIIVGNPPWTYRPGEKGARQAAPSHEEVAQPRRSPDWAFLWRARTMAAPGARVALLMKATPFFSKERGASESRRLLLSSFHDVTVVNLSQLRGEDLFPAVQTRTEREPTRTKATSGPAVLFKGSISRLGDAKQVKLVNVPWSPNFREHGVLDIPPELYKRVPVEAVQSDPTLFKAAVFGNSREFSVMAGLRSAPHLLPLGAWCRSQGIPIEQGLQVGGGGKADASPLQGLRLLDAHSYRPGRVSARLPVFRLSHAHRPRDRAIYKGPLVLCPEAGFAKALQKGRYSAAVSTDDLAYTDSLVGISMAGQDRRLAMLLCTILNSKATAFQLAFGGSNLGLKQPKVEKLDLEALMIPDLSRIDERALERAALLGAQLGHNPALGLLGKLDEYVMDLYGISSGDRRVINDTLFRSSPLFLDTRRERLKTVEGASDRELLEYGQEVTHWLDTLVRDAGSFRTALNRGVRLRPDVIALRFDLEEGPPRPLPPFAISEPELFEFQPLHEALGGSSMPKLQARRFARVYAGRSVYVIKPNERRYWRVSDAQVDVAEIISDQLLWKGIAAARPDPPSPERRWTMAEAIH